MLGPKTPRTDGNLLVVRSAEASRFVMPAVSKPWTTMKMLSINSKISQLMSFANPTKPFPLTVHRSVHVQCKPVNHSQKNCTAANHNRNRKPVQGGQNVTYINRYKRSKTNFEQDGRNHWFSLIKLSAASIS